MEDPPEPTSPSDFGSPAASPVLPSDLPTSLDDRRYTHYDPGVEVYDAWQGMSASLMSYLYGMQCSI